ncbi:MAG: 3'-5' exonuclease [Methylophilaceae bacterium]
MTIENFISVDIETSGPIPGEFSMLSIGACLVNKPECRFECMLKPLNDNADPEALKITGFSLDDLKVNGSHPLDAMQSFGDWLKQVSPENTTPIFVGLNAPFDWSFVNYYFHRFLGSNPFGFSALDIKALYMGAMKTAWKDTKSSVMVNALRPVSRGNHNALDDAIFQAELFRLIQALPPTPAVAQLLVKD